VRTWRFDAGEYRIVTVQNADLFAEGGQCFAMGVNCIGGQRFWQVARQDSG